MFAKLQQLAKTRTFWAALAAVAGAVAQALNIPQPILDAGYNFAVAILRVFGIA